MKAKDLKNSILQQAVQGRLVLQDPSDEPASVLLGRIREERHRLVREGKAKAPKGGESVIYRGSDGSYYERRGKAEPTCIDDEIPFEIPESWGWCRLEILCDDILVPQRDKPQSFGGAIPWCRIEDIEGRYLNRSKAGRAVSSDVVASMNLKVNPVGTVLCSNSATIGVPAITTVSCVTNQRFIGFVCGAALNNSYLYYIFLANHDYLCNCGTGTTQSYIARNTFEKMLIPLPPLTEQSHIVARVDELMLLVEKYGALEDARETLDTDLPNHLRKSILQQAVQGRLVPQDPSDEPASVLLGRIREERHRLVREGKVKTKAPKGGESVIYRGSDGSYYERRGKTEPTCIDDEIPFEIPESWEWARLATIGVLERGSGIKRSQVTEDGLPCVRYGELYTTYSLEIAECDTKIPASLFSSSHTVACGEILMTLTGENDLDIGRAVVNNSGSAIAFGGDLLALKHHMQNGKYLAYCINSAYVGMQRTALATGNIIVHLSAEKIGSFLVAIPPQNEQARIVARLDELTPLIENCGTLENERKSKDAAELTRPVSLAE